MLFSYIPAICRWSKFCLYKINERMDHWQIAVYGRCRWNQRSSASRGVLEANGESKPLVRLCEDWQLHLLSLMKIYIGDRCNNNRCRQSDTNIGGNVGNFVIPIQ